MIKNCGKCEKLIQAEGGKIYCLPCSTSIRLERIEKRREEKAKIANENKEKILLQVYNPSPCEGCGGKMLPSLGNKRKFCRECKIKKRRNDDKIRQKDRRITSGYKEKYKKYMLNKLYGISLEQRDAMLAEQNGCAICHRQDSGWNKDWHVDHCHKTNKVRGILCHPCNLLIGLAKDSSETLLSASKYLLNASGE